MIEELGKTDIPRMKEVMFSFVHGVSGRRGEEFGGMQRDNPKWLPGFKERLTGGVPPEKKHDLVARRTNRAEGNTEIGFALDDRFGPGGPHRVAVKISYRDLDNSRWALTYQTTGRVARSRAGIQARSGRHSRAYLLLLCGSVKFKNSSRLV